MEAWVGGFVSKEHSEFGSVARGADQPKAAVSPFSLGL